MLCPAASGAWLSMCFITRLWLPPLFASRSRKAEGHSVSVLPRNAAMEENTWSWERSYEIGSQNLSLSSPAAAVCRLEGRENQSLLRLKSWASSERPVMQLPRRHGGFPEPCWCTSTSSKAFTADVHRRQLWKTHTHRVTASFPFRSFSVPPGPSGSRYPYLDGSSSTLFPDLHPPRHKDSHRHPEDVCFFRSPGVLNPIYLTIKMNHHGLHDGEGQGWSPLFLFLW